MFLRVALALQPPATTARSGRRSERYRAVAICESPPTTVASDINQ